MLIVDNYDSFTYNIVEYVRILGKEPIVIKNDEMDIRQISNLDFDKIIISPGYGNPDNSGVSMELIKEYHGKKPILGVCVGHQCNAKYFGAEIVQLTEPCHGKTSEVFFEDSDLFKGVPQGFSATRYHSLTVDKNSCEPPIKITAQTKDNIIMALEIENSQTYGVQFHPEAILTEHGLRLIKNFIEV